MTRRKKAHTVSKAERWLNLLAFLLDRRYPVSRDEILSQVEDYCDDWLSRRNPESVRRKFERDKSELRELGVVLEPVRQVESDHSDQPVDAYLLKPRDFYLPYLTLQLGSSVSETRKYHLPRVTLSPSEHDILRQAAARVLALGPTPLGPSAASALRKLSFDLPGVDGAEVEEAAIAPFNEEAQKIFAVLREGLEARKAVRCRYYTIGRDQEEDREIEPYGLLFTWGHWYCIARARDRDAIRVFRLSRMKRATAMAGDAAEFTVPAEFRLADYANRAPWELSDAPPVPSRVRFAFPHSRWTMAEGLGRIVEPLDSEGGAVLEFDVRSPEAFVRWLLPFGRQAEVLEPAGIRDRVAHERERVRALYR